MTDSSTLGMPAPADHIGIILAAIGSAIVLLDPRGTVRVWNRTSERILGIPAAQAVGAPFSSLPIAWDWDGLGALVPGFVPDRPVSLDEVRVQTAEGKEAILAFSITPIDDAHGGGCLWHGADITGRRSMEAQLRQAQKLEAIGGLAAGIAHEINTPMQFIGDNVRFLVSATGGLRRVMEAALLAATSKTEADRLHLAEVEKESDLSYLLEEIPRALSQAEEGIERVSGIVKAMKEFSHPGIDEPVPSDLNHLIESTATVSRNTWKYVADLDLTLDRTLSPVPVVPGGFNQVILNLIVNAAHAIEDRLGKEGGKGRIAITTCMRGTEAMVEVSDSGCGIPEAIRRRIFDPFFTTKEPGRGTGQGLAIVHAEVVERLGGRIELDSQVGTGTTFRLLLPLNPPTTIIRRQRHRREKVAP